MLSVTDSALKSKKEKFKANPSLARECYGFLAHTNGPNPSNLVGCRI